mgnify:CR=1 FL=1
MTTYKNTSSDTNAPATVLQVAQGETKATEACQVVEVDDLELDLSGADHLYTVAGVRYFGRL